LGKEQRLRVSENRVLRKIFGPKREEEGSWRKLYSVEPNNLYYSNNIIRVIKSRRMRWTGHTWGRGDVFRVLVGSPEARDHWEDLGLCGSIALRSFNNANNKEDNWTRS
jgi:hypothetical protein